MKYILITLLSVVWTFGDAISIDVPLGTSNLSVVRENSLSGFLSSGVTSVDPSLKNLDIFSGHLHLAISGSDILTEDTVFTTKVTVFRESPVVIFRGQGLVKAQRNVVEVKQLVEEANVAVTKAESTINEKQTKLEEVRIATQETRIRLDEARKNLAAAQANAAKQGLKKTPETIAAKKALRQAKVDARQGTRNLKIAIRDVNVAEKGKKKAQKRLNALLKREHRAQVRLKRRQLLLERVVAKQNPKRLDEVLISAQDIQTVGQGAGFDFDFFVDLQDYDLNRATLDQYFNDEVFIFRTFVEISASGITNATVNGNETLNITFGAVPETSSYLSVLLGLMMLGVFSMRKRLHQDKALNVV